TSLYFVASFIVFLYCPRIASISFLLTLIFSILFISPRINNLTYYLLFLFHQLFSLSYLFVLSKIKLFVSMQLNIFVVIHFEIYHFYIKEQDLLIHVYNNLIFELDIYIYFSH